MNHPSPRSRSFGFLRSKADILHLVHGGNSETQGGLVRWMYVNKSWRDKKCMENIFPTKTWYYLEIDMIFDMSIFGSRLF